MTPELYPPAPTDVPADLTRPSGRYKRQAAAAVLGVVAFFLVYFGATFWLGLVAYRSFAHFGVNGARGLFVGIPAAFLCLVMVKGLFARRKMSRDGLLEITASDEPELFAFIHRVADDTGAPRPRRVYLSADVNAAVFLDVGLINLLIPSKKNLILGLGLVNSLTLDELKSYLTKHQLSKSYLPEYLEVIEAMPRTASGKIQKFKLREQAKEVRLEPAKRA